MRLSDPPMIDRRNRMARRIADALREQGLFVEIVDNTLVVGVETDTGASPAAELYTVIVSNRRTKKP